MAKNVQEPNSLGVKKGGALIGGGALNGEFTVGHMTSESAPWRYGPPYDLR